MCAMWRPPPDANDADPAALPGTGPGLSPDLLSERFRSYGRFYERYWARIFAVTQSDLTRIADAMRAAGVAADLTTLARQLILARLQHGPEVSSGPAPDGSMPDQIVRAWDADGAWRPGDRMITVVPLPAPGRAYAPRVAEVLRVATDHLVARVDGLSAPQLYPLHDRAFSGYADDHGRLALEKEFAALSEADDEAAQADYVLWRFGHYVVARLLHALTVDRRFVELEGQWFLRELVATPQELGFMLLARAMFVVAGEPFTMQTALRCVRSSLWEALPESPEQRETAKCFGLYLAMAARTDLFDNVGTATAPRWVLAAPPPMEMIARYAVYDPRTYEILCTAGDLLDAATVDRLWQLGLLYAALGPGAVPPMPTMAAPEQPAARPAPDAAPPERPRPPSTPRRRRFRFPFRRR